MKRRQTKKSYTDLYDNPMALFPPDPRHNNNGAKVVLFPNGQSEIWISDQSGTKGYKITAGNGRAGLALHISTFTGSPPITINGNADGDYEKLGDVPDARHLDLTLYDTDPRSQAFKKHYRDGTLDAFFLQFPETTEPDYKAIAEAAGFAIKFVPDSDGGFHYWYTTGMNHGEPGYAEGEVYEAEEDAWKDCCMANRLLRG